MSNQLLHPLWKLTCTTFDYNATPRSFQIDPTAAPHPLITKVKIIHKSEQGALCFIGMKVMNQEALPSPGPVCIFFVAT